jgi:hypothetical protein
MRYLHLAAQANDDQTFRAPVQPESFACRELQRGEDTLHLAFALPLGVDDGLQLHIAAIALLPK